MEDIHTTAAKEVNETEGPEPKQKTRKPRSKAYKATRWIFLGIVTVIAVALLSFIISTSQELPSLSQIENPRSNLATQLISADGEILQNFYVRENRVNVNLHQVSPHLIDGLIATEDLRFYQHSGIDYNTLPAIIARYLRGTTSGGSTITMQLSRNLFDAVGTDRTVPRKIKEVIVSAIIEQKFTKEEILTAYLNTVSIYGQTYGVEMAAQRLFGKSAKDLNVEESATIVAMLKGQGVFNPFSNPDTVIFRRNLVINKMIQHGMVDTLSQNVDSIRSLAIVLADQEDDHVKGPAPYFREHVRKFMKNWCATHTKPDGTPYNLYTDGLKIYTTINGKMQRHAEAAVAEHMIDLQKSFDAHIKGHEPYKYDGTILPALMKRSNRYVQHKKAGLSEDEIKKKFREKQEMKIFTWAGSVDTMMTPWDSLKYYAKFMETGMVSIDPRTGYVKAWVGGIDYHFFKYDHVAKGKRQVGSTFKPFVYAAAMDNGRRPCDEILNQPVFFENVDGNGERWAPKNSNGKFGGLMTLRRGLATSTNLITARLMKDIGPNVVVNYARRMGITSALEAVPALCLGVSDLNVLELTGAYGTFANQGLWVEPIFISRIEDRNGNVIEHFVPETETALSRQKAYEMVELLKGVVDEQGGTASRLRYKYEFTNEIGGKTGTTQNHSDGWFMGVTPALVTGVWVGCSDRRMRFSRMDLGQGANMALPLWAIYMKRMYEDETLNLSQEPFSRPRGYISDLDCGDGFDTQFAGLTRGDSVLQTARLQKAKSKKQAEIDSF